MIELGVDGDIWSRKLSGGAPSTRAGELSID